jgi:hypothetical protein
LENVKCAQLIAFADTQLGEMQKVIGANAAPLRLKR